MGAALEATADWLGAALLSALMRISHGSPEIRLVAVGHLNVLPLQIARRPDCSAPTGYRYLADELLVSFLPSAKFLPAAPGTQRAAPPDRGAVLIDAKDPTLGGTSRELDAIAEALGPRSQRREVGDPSALIAALRASDVAHVACHGAGDPVHPLESGLILASKDRVTVRDLLAEPGFAPRLVTMSACESAVSDARHPDEAVSLPTALLLAGAQAAVGSAWAVLDAPTALLMARLYDLWQ
jgi:CHAT domain-containing protein